MGDYYEFEENKKEVYRQELKGEELENYIYSLFIRQERLLQKHMKDYKPQIMLFQGPMRILKRSDAEKIKHMKKMIRKDFEED